MTKLPFALVPLPALTLALAACNQAPAPAPVESESPTPVATPTETTMAAPDPAATDADPGLPTPPPPPMASDQEKAARGVLLEWARALEVGQYDRSYATFGAEAEARSGMTKAGYAAFWKKFKTITIAMPTGTMEGAAGSSYYTAPTTVVGKTQDGRPYRLEGDVILRRVNDVPGATQDQLTWHVEKVDLKPV